MSPMTATELRRAFLAFFEERGHTVVPSASLIPHDPDLLFTVAGMVPFKPYFLGEQPPPFPRATTVQKCVRAGGKDSDLEEVGRDARHLSFFEMLGNFSFGDYFKHEAIPMAWDMVTNLFGIDPDVLWVTCHVTDDEAAEIWRDEVGVDPARIQRLDADNWWGPPGGPPGPCGPCSEIYVDKGPAYGPDGGPAKGGDERFLEIWNLVFMQFARDVDGTDTELPKKNIDTGAGLERILGVLQGVDSVFETDVLAPLVETAQRVTGTRLGASDRSDISLRILAEHARTMTFLVSDGVFPSNEGRGYVLRRIIRRAVREAYLLDVADIVTPDARRHHRRDHGRVLPRPREAPRLRAQRRGAGGGALPGHAALGHQPARRRARQAPRGRLASAARWRSSCTTPTASRSSSPARSASSAATTSTRPASTPRWPSSGAGPRTPARAGRARPASSTRSWPSSSAPPSSWAPTSTRSRPWSSAVTDDSVVLDRTPFYAESGGQVGDTGWITSDTGRAEVLDTVYGAPGVVRHKIGPVEGELEVGQSVRAAIDGDRRDAIRRNHTATHLLHWALREVLGDHVKQQGSLVDADRLRFDFSHYEALTDDEIRQIEDLVARDVLANPPARHYETTKDHAEQIGAIAFFGDKYGDVVKVLEAGPHSTELCGGTHVKALGDIGPVKIISEASIGSNIRRIEAVSGTGPIERLRADEARIKAAADVLGVATDELVDAVERRVAETKELRARGPRPRAPGRHRVRPASSPRGAVDGVVVAAGRRARPRRAPRPRGGGPRRARHPGRGPRQRPRCRRRRPGRGGRPRQRARTRPSCIADAARAVKGGGGKSADLAVAGGKDPAALDDALDLARAAAGIA